VPAKLAMVRELTLLLGFATRAATLPPLAMIAVIQVFVVFGCLD
jgi:hypothetical protein